MTPRDDHRSSFNKPALNPLTIDSKGSSVGKLAWNAGFGGEQLTCPPVRLIINRHKIVIAVIVISVRRPQRSAFPHFNPASRGENVRKKRE